MPDKLNTSDVESAVAKYFNPRINLIVPNVYWGLGFSYELDLLICSQSFYCTEVEIKVSKSDIKAEQNKRHTHRDNKIKRFFYAVPWYLQDCEYLPSNCGLIVVDDNLRCKTMRPPRVNRFARRLTPDEHIKLLELGCMRIWTLKETIADRRRRAENRVQSQLPEAP